MALASVGDEIEVNWPTDDASSDGTTRFLCVVSKISRSKRSKHGSMFKYRLDFKDSDGAVRTTRLAHLDWHLVGNAGSLYKRPRLSQPSSSVLSDTALRFICAPMVGGSELPFRLLTRRYGATLAYTPMINSVRFATDAAYRAAEFQTTPEDRPLVAHFSANDPQHLLAAAKLVEDQCDAIDLNLGCPQRVACQGHFGSFLLDEADRPLVLDIVRTCAQGVRIPMFVKIRLLDTVPDTIRLCEQLAEAGAALIAIHARYRVNLSQRTGPGARDGAAHLDQVTTIRAHMRARFPLVKIIANGNIRCFEDAVLNHATTLTDGVMSAEALLDNPALFAPSMPEFTPKTQPSQLTLAKEYIALAAEHGPVKIKTLIFHTRRIIRDLLTKYQLMEECVNCKSLSELSAITALIAEYEDGSQSFAFDRDKALREKAAIERRKQEEGKRKAFEDRMRRKAKREGLKDLDFYLQVGAENPTQEELNAWKGQLGLVQDGLGLGLGQATAATGQGAGVSVAQKQCSTAAVAVAEGYAAAKEAVFATWKQRHSQHCWEYHFNPQGCHRDRTCSFLHVDANFAEDKSEVYG